MNDKIRAAMRDRDYHYRQAVKSNSSYHWEMDSELRNSLNKEIKSSMSKYYRELIEESKGDSNKILKAINAEVSCYSESSTPVVYSF